MLDLKALLNKILTHIKNATTLTHPTMSITTSSGVLTQITTTQYNGWIQLYLYVRNASAVASGANIYTGTITTTGLRPQMYCMGCGYIGAYSIMGSITSDGAITIRNSTSRSITTGSNSIVITFVYPPQNGGGYLTSKLSPSDENLGI